MPRRPKVAAGPGKLKLLPLAAVLFFTVSGGPYGLEQVVQSSGAVIALILILVAPIIWSMPSALMVCEMEGMMPHEGGYYVWVRDTLGPMFGFYEGWWTWLYTFVDMALYPVLFVDYLAHFVGVRDPLTVWALRLAVIWLCTTINLRGVRIVGDSSILFGSIILIPFLIITIIGLTHAKPLAQLPFITEGKGLIDSFAIGLCLILWNYLGWDNATTIAGEVENPARTYLGAILVAFPLIVAAYFLPVFAGLAAGVEVSQWKDGAWPEIARILGGEWLGTTVAIAGMASAAGLLTSSMLAISRTPKVMAQDHFMPAFLGKQHPKFKTPWGSILLCGIVISGLAFLSFDKIIIIDVFLYGLELMLEFAAFLVLRHREPDRHRPYRVPGGLTMAYVITLLPLACLVTAFTAALSSDSEASNATYFAIAMASSAPVVYFLFARPFRKRKLARAPR
jgi:amino acid transporter